MVPLLGFIESFFLFIALRGVVEVLSDRDFHPHSATTLLLTWIKLVMSYSVHPRVVYGLHVPFQL